MRKLRILACFGAAVVAALASTGSGRFDAFAQKRAPDAPPADLVARLDAVVQARFHTAPSFGGRRLLPDHHINPHMNEFYAERPSEKKLVQEIGDAGWKAFILLYGRSVTPFPAGSKRAGAFDIDYKVNRPIAVAGFKRESEMPRGESLLGVVKDVFIGFQQIGGAGENGFEFERRGWNYYARPVRATEESCVSCHRDYVITERLPAGQFRFRPRRIGDANGVLVYGFRRR